MLKGEAYENKDWFRGKLSSAGRRAFPNLEYDHGYVIAEPSPGFIMVERCKFDWGSSIPHFIRKHETQEDKIWHRVFWEVLS